MTYELYELLNRAAEPDQAIMLQFPNATHNDAISRIYTVEQMLSYYRAKDIFRFKLWPQGNAKWLAENQLDNPAPA